MNLSLFLLFGMTIFGETTWALSPPIGTTTQHSWKDIKSQGFTPVDFGRFPWLGKLISHNGLCSGTLVSPTYVLSAAHCAGTETSKWSQFTFLLQANQGASAAIREGKIAKTGFDFRAYKEAENAYNSSSKSREDFDRLVTKFQGITATGKDWMLIKLDKPIIFEKYPDFRMLSPGEIISQRWLSSILKLRTVWELGYPAQFNSNYPISTDCIYVKYVNGELVGQCRRFSSIFGARGMSGGPVVNLSEDKNEIVGLVSGIYNTAAADFLPYIFDEIIRDREAN